MNKKLAISLLILILFGICVFVGLTINRSKEKTIQYQSTERKYRIHLPKNYNASKKYPLVIGLHALTDLPRIFEIYTGLSRKADQEGFIVVYPYGSTEGQNIIPASWNARFCCGYAVEKNIDDVGFISALIDEVLKNNSVDSKRVYLVGFANGAMLSNLLAAKLTDKITAVASVASAVGAKPEGSTDFRYLEKSQNVMPIILFNGKSDSVVKFDGGGNDSNPLSFTGAYDTLNFWLDTNKCLKSPSEVVNQGNYTEEVYKQCAPNSEVTFFAVNTGHVWPGGILDFKNYFVRKHINATDEIWKFFSKYTK